MMMNEYVRIPLNVAVESVWLKKTPIIGEYLDSACLRICIQQFQIGGILIFM